MTTDQVWCSDPECFMPATVLVRDLPYCTADGRDASGGRL